MEKKKMAKALMLTAALAGGMALANSFTNEVQASGATCKCALTWFGSGCKSDNYGGTCATGTNDCSLGNRNCSN